MFPVHHAQAIETVWEKKSICGELSLVIMDCRVHQCSEGDGADQCVCSDTKGFCSLAVFDALEVRKCSVLVYKIASLSKT